jgi:putative sigma-54 modulation protein
MHVDYTGRNTAVTLKWKQQVETELARIETIAGYGIGAHVILTVDKYRQIADVTLKTGAETLVATCEGTDMAAALHDALRRIEQQILRHKERRLTVQRQRKPNSNEPFIDVVTPTLQRQAVG